MAILRLVPVHQMVRQGFYFPLAPFWFRRGIQEITLGLFCSKN